MRFIRFSLLLFICFFILHCSGGDGQQKSIKSTIGPSGGVANGPGSSFLNIPAGALSEVIEIVFERVTDLQEPQESIRVGEFYTISPLETPFQKAATLLIPYSAATVPSGYEVQLAMLEGNQWIHIEGEVKFGFLEAKVTKLASFTPVAVKTSVSPKDDMASEDISASDISTDIPESD